MASVTNYIYIYKGQGTDKFCVEATKQSLCQLIPHANQRIIEIEDPSYLGSHGCLTQRNLLIIPGGNAFQIESPFSSLTKKIQKAIDANTLSYFGICAGSFVGGSNILRLTDRPCFPPSTGELFEPHATPICMRNGETFHIVRWGGGYYKKADPSETPLAYYQSTENIAVLQPRDNVVLCNVHPELQLGIPYVEANLPIYNGNERKLLVQSSANQQKLLVDILNLVGVKATELPFENLYSQEYQQKPHEISEIQAPPIFTAPEQSARKVNRAIALPSKTYPLSTKTWAIMQPYHSPSLYRIQTTALHSIKEAQENTVRTPRYHFFEKKP